MPRGTQLTAYEKGQINAFHRDGKGIRAIARLLNRSHHVIINYLKGPAVYCTKKRMGRKKKLTKRDEQRISRMTSNSKVTCKEIKSTLGVNVHRTTILRSIQRNQNITRQKMLVAPSLTQMHKHARLDFCRNNMQRNWEHVSY
jgi:IS30 family transposase